MGCWTRLLAALAAIAAVVAGVVVAPRVALAAPPPSSLSPVGAPRPAPAPRSLPQPTDTVAISSGDHTGAAQRSAIGAAVTKARATGKPVTVDALTTETELVAAQPSGRLAVLANPTPVRTRQGPCSRERSGGCQPHER